MAHGQEVRSLTFYEVIIDEEAGTSEIFETLEEANAFEQSLDQSDNLAELSIRLKQDLQKRADRTADLENDLATALKQLAEAEGKDKDEAQLTVDKIENELEQLEIKPIERAVYLGEDIRDSSLNAYENFKLFVLGETELFLQIVSEYANAYNFGSIRYNESELWFGEDFRGLPAKRVMSAQATLQFEVPKEG